MEIQKKLGGHLVRVISSAAPEVSLLALRQCLPLAARCPDLLRSFLPAFWIRSDDSHPTQEVKLELIEMLADERNSTAVMREFQVYFRWHRRQDFIHSCMKRMSNIALKIPALVDPCLRGLLQMLDSKCAHLAAEAVVAIRTLLQHHAQAGTGSIQLGSVIAHLTEQLTELQAPTARASVLWIIGHYQDDIKERVPDVLRQLAKSFAQEKDSVKVQIMALALKVWWYHQIHTVDQVDVKRLNAIVDFILKSGGNDVSWDVRDVARFCSSLKGSERLSNSQPDLPLAQMMKKIVTAATTQGGGGSRDHAGSICRFSPDSMAYQVNVAFQTYRPLPEFALEALPDSVRDVQVQVTKPAERSLESAPVVAAAATSAVPSVPSNIQAMPKVETLEDLDLFYSDPPKPTQEVADVTGVAAPARGIAVSGEDEESEVSDSDSKSESKEDWKFCEG